MLSLQRLKNHTFQNHLKLGFVIFIIGTITLSFQFLIYLLQSNIAVTIDVVGYGYYLLAAFSHAGLFAFIPYLIIYFLINPYSLSPNYSRPFDYFLLFTESYSIH